MIYIASSQVFYIILSPLFVFEQERCVLNIFYSLQGLHEEHSFI